MAFIKFANQFAKKPFLTTACDHFRERDQTKAKIDRYLKAIYFH